MAVKQHTCSAIQRSSEKQADSYTLSVRLQSTIHHTVRLGTMRPAVVHPCRWFAKTRRTTSRTYIASLTPQMGTRHSAETGQTLLKNGLKVFRPAFLSAKVELTLSRPGLALNSAAVKRMAAKVAPSTSSSRKSLLPVHVYSWTRCCLPLLKRSR